MKKFKIRDNLSLLLSIGIHLIFIAFFYSTGYEVNNSYGEIAELTFMEPGGGGGDGSDEENTVVEKTEEPVVKEPVKEDVISTNKKKKTEKKEVAAKQEVRTGTSTGTGSGGGTGGGTGTGSGTGTGPGTGSGTAINIPPPPKVEKKILTKGDFLAAAEIMPSPLGGYDAIKNKVIVPADAKSITGTVYVRAFVDEMGRVLIVSIDKGIGHGLDKAAADAVRKTKFSPGKNGGKPVKVQIQVPVHI